MKNKEFYVRDTQLSITDIRAHLCYQWGMFFSPTDFTDFHGFSRNSIIGFFPAALEKSR